MHFNTLKEFRHGLYGCFLRSADALFQAADALLSYPQAQSFAELALAPCFERRWPSLYAAFADGQIDRARLRALFAQYAPLPSTARLLLGLDASNIPRPESATSADRSALFVHNLPDCRHPITWGWQFSSLVVLPSQPSSWTYTLDNQRIPTDQTPSQLAASQLQAVVPLLPLRPLLTADRHYGSARFVCATRNVPCDKLLRICSNRVFYRPPPPDSGKRGRPRLDGAPFKCHDESTHGPADRQWQGTDEQGKCIAVAAWEQLHYRAARDITLTVVRLTRHGATGKKGDPRVSWFIWVGQEALPLAEVWPSYRLRFSMEHGYRFGKQDLLWEQAHLRTPEQFQRWTDIMEGVRNQLVVGRAEVGVVRRPWERARCAASPQQVRRAMAGIMGELGSEARRSQVRGKAAPGRAVGALVKPAKRYAVVRKQPRQAKTARSRVKRRR